VVCAPVLDLRFEETTDAIGDRAYGRDPAHVATLAQSMADGLLSAGVQPVGKHAPGHGHARVDSHYALPVVDEEVDLAPDIAVFGQCASLPWMMTAHILYLGLDREQPATLSPHVIAGVIRGTIGFDGVLVSDDLAMSALTGPAGSRARDAVAAGCDLALHCSGRLADSRAVLGAVPDVSATTRTRLARAASLAARSRLSLERASLAADQAELLAAVAAA
jgi:beta-N-acetylhexosaminidase